MILTVHFSIHLIHRLKTLETCDFWSLGILIYVCIDAHMHVAITRSTLRDTLDHGLLYNLVPPDMGHTVPY